ncbi:MAG: phospho-N-acetylmuramoyl-pentapeptide-transferase [Planctomycetota bacterium]
MHEAHAATAWARNDLTLITRNPPRLLYLLIQFIDSKIDGGLDSTFFSFLRIFTFIEFRAVLAMIVAFAVVVLSGKRVIRWLVTQKIGDNPEFHNKDINELMKSKANTPTMGGVMIVGAIVLVTLLLADISRQNGFYVWMGLVCLVAMASIGMADDWLKLTTARRKPGSRDGLRSWEKLMFQLGLAVLLGIFVYHHGVSKFSAPDEQHVQLMSQSLNLPGLKTWVYNVAEGAWMPSQNLIILPGVVFVILAVLFIAGTSNAVNLTDGMDGLAGGITLIVAFAFLVLCLIAGYERGDFILAQYLLVPHIPFADELAVLAGAMAGACLGFLWFNCHPAQVFMGDTGSLALGGTLGYLAIVTRQELLLLIIGGVFFFEMLSVILQVGSFKLRGGKRIFKCAPVHHHFHMVGWTEQQVVVRFWLITVLLAAIALSTIKLR